MGDRPLYDFDGRALFAALDARRAAEQLSWQGLADAIWATSATLNARRNDHPISPSTVVNLGRRGDTTCQHALFFLRWLERSPEEFLTGAPDDYPTTPLPPVGPDRRLRWDLRRTYKALNDRRLERELSWREVADILERTPSQLTGLRTARYATGMGTAMRITQWLEVPASTFVVARGG